MSFSLTRILLCHSRGPCRNSIVGVERCFIFEATNYFFYHVSMHVSDPDLRLGLALAVENGGYSLLWPSLWMINRQWVGAQRRAEWIKPSAKLKLIWSYLPAKTMTQVGFGTVACAIDTWLEGQLREPPMSSAVPRRQQGRGAIARFIVNMVKWRRPIAAVGDPSSAYLSAQAAAQLHVCQNITRRTVPPRCGEI